MTGLASGQACFFERFYQAFYQAELRSSKIASNEIQAQRDAIADQYFDQLQFEPYPVQEEALLAWYTSEQGVLVCAPTGTGKTLIAEAAIFEALKLGKTAYYTTPLIALTDQKFRDLQESVVRWGYSADDVGLVTGNRQVNPKAKILVVVAEILLNRLLHSEAFDFSEVWAVVMDEFHSFNDRERGIVWEFGLGLLPAHVKTLLLSATVGNSLDFSAWLSRTHGRNLVRVESSDRKVPLTYHWIDDQILPDQIETMVRGDEDSRYTPALLFCFNRELCWTLAETLKGKKCVGKEQQKQLAERLEAYDWSQGVGPKLKQILIRGVGVHHAGVLPRYRRIVESLFQEKLLSVCVCTETLAAGINLPARSIVLPTLLKGPRGRMKLIEASSAHQMFGRAGRPQFDDQGHVFGLPHEDDVKILKWKEKYDQIPEDTKDPGLRKAKKALKKKQPKRREGQQYWSEKQFQQLVTSASADLASRGPLSWRLLVYMLDACSDVAPIRKLINGRLMTPQEKVAALKRLDRQLLTLWRGGYVTLDPRPPLDEMGAEQSDDSAADSDTESVDSSESDTGPLTLNLGQRTLQPEYSSGAAAMPKKEKNPSESDEPAYRALAARPTEKLNDLSKLRGVHPLYAVFLMSHLGIADRNERIMAFESILELSRSLGPAIRIPKPEFLPSGPLATTRLDSQLLTLGLATAEEIGLAEKNDDEEESKRGWYDEDEYVPILTLPHKLQRLFQHDFPTVDDVRVTPVWVVGEVLNYSEFNKYITANKLQKQEGVVFRHMLRFILLIDEMAELCPPDIPSGQWQDELYEIADRLEEICRAADSQSTDQWLTESRTEEQVERNSQEPQG